MDVNVSLRKQQALDRFLPQTIDAQVFRARRGEQNFGIFSSIGKALGGVVKTVGKVATGLIPGTLDDRLFDALVNRGGSPPPGTTPSLDDFRRRRFGGPQSFTPEELLCVPPFFLNTRTGKCELDVVPGAGGGGRGGDRAGAFGAAVVGAFGIPALEPATVGSITRNDGTVSPQLRCPGGTVLGRDDLCYMKGTIPRQFRKWPPARKPPFTAAEFKTLKTAERVRGKVKRIASASGLTCTTRRTGHKR